MPHRGHGPLLLALALALVASCGGSTWEQSVAHANEEKKVLIVEFYATWCRPCKWFESHVLEDEDVVTALELVEFRRYDFDSTQGRHYANRLGVSAVPAVVAIGRDGKGFRQLRGAVAKTTFLRFLDWAKTQVYPQR